MLKYYRLHIINLRYGDIMKKISKEKKKLIFDALLVLIVLVAVAAVSFLLLYAFDVIYFDEGIAFNSELFSAFKNAWYGWIVFMLFQAIITMFLCIVPGISMALIVLCTTIYTEPWEAFIVSFISVLISSIVMYLLGRFGGYKLCERILGKEECERTMPLLSSKSLVYFPLMMLFPIFPDDALVMLAGTVRMKLGWFIPSIVIGRGIGVATIVFGISLVPFDSFTSLYDWLVFFTVIIVWVFIIFSLAGKLNAFIEKNNRKNESEGK